MEPPLGGHTALVKGGGGLRGRYRTGGGLMEREGHIPSPSSFWTNSLKLQKKKKKKKEERKSIKVARRPSGAARYGFCNTADSDNGVHIIAASTYFVLLRVVLLISDITRERQGETESETDRRTDRQGQKETERERQ